MTSPARISFRVLNSTVKPGAYKPFKVDVAVIHGSQADVVANISTSEEPAELDTYAVALAAHNNGGMVIAQVKSTADQHFVPARKVTVPGVMIDHIVECPAQWRAILPNTIRPSPDRSPRRMNTRSTRRQRAFAA